MSEEYTTDEIMTVLIAREVNNDDIMIVGVSTPMVWAAFTLAKVTHAPDAIYHYIMGNTFVYEPREVSLLYLEMNLHRGYKFQTSAECTLEYLPSDTLTTIEFFRPAQIDENGNTNNICIGDWYNPKVRLPGCAGIADFSMLYSRGQFFYCPRHDKRTFVSSDKMDFVSGVGFKYGEKSDSGGSGPQCMITDLAYLTFDDKTKRMKIGSIHPGVDLDEVIENTGFDLVIPENLETTKPPTKRELKLLREKVDPLNIRKLEVLRGKEKEELLNCIIEKELEKENKFPKLLTSTYIM
ncbi:MAG: 3-oxoadipate CoA-transferase subunit B [Promethearchaeota archaeon]|nr:MAG: 3-oxoadipate CoA-transferase subunit B [Candidatus Lokiarchaeota archaeon]